MFLSLRNVETFPKFAIMYVGIENYADRIIYKSLRRTLTEIIEMTTNSPGKSPKGKLDPFASCSSMTPLLEYSTQHFTSTCFLRAKWEYPELVQGVAFRRHEACPVEVDETYGFVYMRTTSGQSRSYRQQIDVIYRRKTR